MSPSLVPDTGWAPGDKWAPGAGRTRTGVSSYDSSHPATALSGPNRRRRVIKLKALRR